MRPSKPQKEVFHSLFQQHQGKVYAQFDYAIVFYHSDKFLEQYANSDIEKDIVDFSGYEDPFSQTDERLKIALRMLKNYNRRVPDLIKQKAHDEIKNSFHSSYRQEKQKIKDRKQENHEKFFLGSVLISFFKSQNICLLPLSS